MKTLHVCEVCGFTSENLADVSSCENQPTVTRFAVGEEVVINGRSANLTAKITGIIYAARTHEPRFEVVITDIPTNRTELAVLVKDEISKKI